jgi:HD-like signal output (HDOD) protein
MEQPPSLDFLVERAGKLFVLPDIIFKLQELIYSDTSDVEQIAEVIGTDPTLTARLLRLANSGFYSFPAQVDTISRAVTIVGTNEIYNLALATVAVHVFREVKADELDLPGFWHLSVTTGLAARSIAEQSGLRNGESLFVAGLLHHIGHLVVAEQWPQGLSALREAGQQVSYWEVEKQVLGFTLAECGARLLALWNLPVSLSQPVQWQHEVLAAPEEHQLGAAAIHVASRAARDKDPRASQSLVDDVDDRVWEILDLTRDNLRHAMSVADAGVMQILQILRPGKNHDNA